ncbi:MAG: hypothetical protein WDN00_12915 [Limisphaerales bacterium]
MKPKIILCLALIFNGGLFGCATKPDAIDLFVANLSADHGLWQNGFDTRGATQAKTPEDKFLKRFE